MDDKGGGYSSMGIDWERDLVKQIFARFDSLSLDLNTTSRAVATLLERTATHGVEITANKRHIMDHCVEIAKLTTKVTIAASVAGAVTAFIIEFLKSHNLLF